MADDFNSLVRIPKPPSPYIPRSQRTYEEMSLTAAECVWYVFRSTSPDLDAVKCAAKALRQCLRSSDGLGWLIWDQAAGWQGAGTTWSRPFEKDFRRLIQAHPPWVLLTREHTRSRDRTIDQNRIKMMVSRIRQWLARCYGAPLSNPRWSALLRHTCASKATRYKIMEKARSAKLIPAITSEMHDSLKRWQYPTLEQQQQKRQAHKRRQKRAQKLQQRREEEWKQKRRLEMALGEELAAELKRKLADAEREIERLKRVTSCSTE